MNSQFYKTKILLPAISILIATFVIVPALSEQGFAQSTGTEIRKSTDRVSDTSIDISSLVPEISDVKPVDIFDTEPKVKFRGGTEGWSLIGGYAFDSGIKLEGTAVRGDDGIWQVEAEGKLNVHQRNAKLVLKGEAHDGHLVLHGKGILENGPEFRIILVGNYAPTLVEGEYALGFKGAYVNFSDNGFRFPMMQVGKVFVSPA